MPVSDANGLSPAFFNGPALLCRFKYNICTELRLMTPAWCPFVKFVVCAVVTLSLLSTPPPVHARDSSRPPTEYELKAAFIHKFMVFTDWPQDKLPDPNQPFVLTIIGDDPFGDAFQPLKDEMVKGRKVVINRLKGIDSLDESDAASRDKLSHALMRSQVIFVCSSEQKHIKEILRMVTGRSILTVADMPGFVESGGMVGLGVEKAKIRFEVNSTAVSRAELKMSSQLLRLAKKVIRDSASENG
jgi:hypothetical protein